MVPVVGKQIRMTKLETVSGVDISSLEFGPLRFDSSFEFRHSNLPLPLIYDDRMTRKANALVRSLVVILILAGLGAGGYFAAIHILRPEIVVTTTVEGPVVQAFYATGTILPEREYSIRSNVAGVIVKMLVDKGDHVTKGQPLAVMMSDDIEFKLKQAQADLVEKERLADEKTSPMLQEYDANLSAFSEMLAAAQRESDRVKSLASQNVATQSDLDRTVDRIKTSWKEVEAAKTQKAVKRIQLERDLAVVKAALQIAQYNFDQQTLKSPIDGVVLDRPVSLGTRVAINDHVMQVADVSAKNLVMRAAVDEEDKTKLQIGQVVNMTLYAFEDVVLFGKVGKIYDKAESDRRTFEVDVRVDPESPQFSLLAPGMTGELAFVVSRKDVATVVPAQAWQDGSLWTVRDGKLARLSAEIGLRSVERIEVTSKLPAGEIIVISPVGAMAEGQIVRLKHADPTAAANLNTPKTQKAFRGL